MRCRKKVKIKKAEEIVNARGMRSLKGVCPKCGTKVYRILGKADE
jgi:rRNA maturation protein Nop10